MRYTRVDIAGETGLYATVSRKRSSQVINVEIIAPGRVRKMDVGVGNAREQCVAAEAMQSELDGRPGSAADIRPYQRVIEHFLD